MIDFGLLKREQAQRSLHEFMRQAWPVVEPSVDFVDNWHIEHICNKLEAVSRGEVRRLLINIPPRHCKSLLVSVIYPVWDWIQNPSRKFLFASYAQSLSTRDAVKSRRLLQSPWFRDNWGHLFDMAGDQNVKSRYENTRLGYRLSTSVGGGLTGEGGDTIIIDDPLNAIDQHSETKRIGCIEWWDQAMSTRLNDPKTGAYIVIMQRLHEDDLAGHILKSGIEWDHICIPAEYEPDHPYVYDGDPRSAEGDLLWPERIGRDQLEELKSKMTKLIAAGQLQQRPAPAGGGLFKRDHMRFYKQDEECFYVDSNRVAKSETWRFITADLALTQKENSDYTVIAHWAVTNETDLILTKVERMREEAPTVEKRLKQLAESGIYKYVGIEKAHYGMAVCQNLKREGCNIKELKADRDKVSRSIQAQIMLENGKIYFPYDGLGVDILIEEMLQFPTGKHDDAVDAVSYAAMCLHENKAVIFFDGEEL